MGEKTSCKKPQADNEVLKKPLLSGVAMARKITEISSLLTFLGDFLISVHLITAVSLVIMITEKIKEGAAYEAEYYLALTIEKWRLMQLFKESSDIKTADQLHLPTPTRVYHNVVAQPTEIQKSVVQELSERAARVRAGIVDASTDNMLKIASDGRKPGLDQHVINPKLSDEAGSNVNLCVDNIYSV